MSEISKRINSEQISFSGQVFEDQAFEHQAFEHQALEDNELAAISGGDMDDLKTQSQLYSFLTSAMDNVIKSIGEGLQSAARKN
jgi:hypothetical protein